MYESILATLNLDVRNSVTNRIWKNATSRAKTSVSDNVWYSVWRGVDVSALLDALPEHTLYGGTNVRKH